MYDCGVATPVVFEGLVYVPATTEPRTTDYVCSGAELEYLTIMLDVNRRRRIGLNQLPRVTFASTRRASPISSRDMGPRTHRIGSYEVRTESYRGGR